VTDPVAVVARYQASGQPPLTCGANPNHPPVVALPCPSDPGGVDLLCVACGASRRMDARRNAADAAVIAALTPDHPGSRSDSAAPHAWVRRDARPTETAAAARAAPRSGTQRMAVLHAVASAGDHGATDDEIAQVSGIIPPRVASRRKELLDGGWVRDSGATRPTRTGADAIVWVLADGARADYDALTA